MPIGFKNPLILLPTWVVAKAFAVAVELLFSTSQPASIWQFRRAAEGFHGSISLSADHEAKAATRRAAATKADLKALATRFMDRKQGIILIVGPRAKILPQLADLGLPVPEFRTADGD